MAMPSNATAPISAIGLGLLHGARHEVGNFVHGAQMMREDLTIAFEFANQPNHAFAIHQLNVDSTEISQDAIEFQQTLLLAVAELREFEVAIFAQQGRFLIDDDLHPRDDILERGLYVEGAIGR
jgi:hypothetical protein